MRLATGGMCLLAGSFAPALTAQVGPDHEAVRRVVLAVAEGIAGANVPALDTLYAHEAWVRILEGAGANRGWADYRDNHLGPELEAMENLQYRYYDVETQVRGDVAWAAFRYRLSVEMDGRGIERIGRGTMVLEKRRGQWKIVHSHTSGREPRPGEGP